MTQAEGLQGEAAAECRAEVRDVVGIDALGQPVTRPRGCVGVGSAGCGIEGCGIEGCGLVGV